jgi:hypothetical protein
MMVLKLIKSANWSKAIERFNHCLKLNPTDQLSQIYVDRCEFLKSPIHQRKSGMAFG